MKKKLLVGGLGLAVIGISSLAFISKPTYQEVKINDLESEKIALYVKNDTGNYEKATTIPTSGYILNEEKSRCNNNAKPSWNKTTNSLKIKDLSNDNTSCYLYFDKQEIFTAEDTLLKLNIKNYKTETPDFSQVAIEDEGIFKVSDGMYGGNSYYWRGATTTNYVKFAGLCWRIVRINGDGSIRLIYDGTACHANGTNTEESIAVTTIKYNVSYNQSNYVGWTYEGISQRTIGGTASNVKTQLESWYSANITGINATKVANGKYCNDRDVQSESTWVLTGTGFNYATYNKINTGMPTLSCPSGDVYILNVGLITADEVMYAGGRFENNTSYYLYNGQNYWSMSPSDWYGSLNYANVFAVNTSGHLSNDRVTNTRGLRPVINLVSSTQFKSGTNGTLDNPYVVEGAE